MDNLKITNSAKASSSQSVFGGQSYDNFFNMDGEDHSFDHNAEADYLLSNINSPSSGMMKNNNLLNMSRFEGWDNENPLYKFPNEDTHNYHRDDNSQHDLILKYLNGVDFDKNLQPFDDNKLLDYLLGEKGKNESRLDNLVDIKSKENPLNFDEVSNKSYKSDRAEKNESSYITEGTGTIMKIIEASQLWLKHTSAEKVPIKLKKQFTKNDNFVVLIKKQTTH